MRRPLGLLVIAALGAAACTADDQGQINLSLIGQAPSGTTYRLRDAVLTIDGPGGARVFRTEDDPDRTHIRARLESGAYTVQLASGWRLEKLVAGAPRPVEATLTSPQPLGFQIGAGELTAVVLRFQAGAEDVGLGDGDLDLSIGVDEIADAGVPDASPPPLQFETSVSALPLTEGGSGSIGVRLSTMPAAPVIVHVLSGNAAVALTAPSQLLFTPSTWDQLQVITVTAAHDDDVVAGQVDVHVAASGIPTAVIPVSIADDDRQALVFDPPVMTLQESESETVSLRLAFRPQGPVTVTVTSPEPTRVTVDPTSFLVTPADWTTPRTITMTALPGSDAGPLVRLRAEGDGGSSTIGVVIHPAPIVRTLGWPTPGTSPVVVPAGELQLYQVDLDNIAAVQELRVFAAGGGQARLVIYGNGGTRPDFPIVITSPLTLLPAPQATSTTQVMQSIGPGRYWIGLVVSAPTSIFEASPPQPVARCRAPMDFRGGFPTGSAFTCTQGAPLAVAATVHL